MKVKSAAISSGRVPDRLIINVGGPGNLIISRGDSLIGTLLNGRLEGHGFDIYQARWLQESQEAFAQWAIRECFKDYGLDSVTPDSPSSGEGLIRSPVG
jgi:hypothetical protein